MKKPISYKTKLLLSRKEIRLITMVTFLKIIRVYSKKIAYVRQKSLNFVFTFDKYRNGLT